MIHPPAMQFRSFIVPAQETPPPKWYVARVATRREARAVESLKAAGLIPYLPMHARWRWVRGVKERVEHPLFPGYLFVAAQPEQSALIREADGIHDVLSTLGPDGELHARAIPSAWIASLILCEHYLGLFDATLSAKKKLRFERGKVAKIGVGQFMGMLAEMLEPVDAGRVKVAVAGFLGGGRMTVKLDDLQPIDDDGGAP